MSTTTTITSTYIIMNKLEVRTSLTKIKKHSLQIKCENTNTCIPKHSMTKILLNENNYIDVDHLTPCSMAT